MSLKTLYRSLLIAMSLAAALASPRQAQAILISYNYTMPAGIDPDKKIFFAFNGDSATFTGNDLITGAPGVELHVVSGSGLLVNQVILQVEGAVPDCLQPLLGEVTSLIDNAEFPSVTIPWFNVPPSPFPLTLLAQPGAVRIGQPITSTFFGPGLAYGTLELTAASQNDILALDPDCLEAFRALEFRATGLGVVVPEPGQAALGMALAGSGLLASRRRSRTR